MIYRTVTVEPELSDNVIEVTPSISENVIGTTAEITTTISYSEMPTYEGTTEITPSSEAQVLETRNMALYDNITINPIPSNYGLITWNGSTLTVS